MTYDVATELVIEDHGAGGRGRSTICRLAWRREDPLAVAILLTPQSEHPSLPRGSWVVLRDFLRYGLEEPTGDGDVRLRPSGAFLHMELLRGLRPAVLRVPVTLIEAFLDATDAVVPAGEERSAEALDALIDRLLEHGGPEA